MHGRTTIFISHAVSTVRNADRIAVLYQDVSSNWHPRRTHRPQRLLHRSLQQAVVEEELAEV